MRYQKIKVLGVILASTLAIVTAPAFAQTTRSSMMPLGGTGNTAGNGPYNTPNTNMPVVFGQQPATPSTRNNFTFIAPNAPGAAVASPVAFDPNQPPMGEMPGALPPLPAMVVAAPPTPPAGFSDPVRQGYGQSYDEMTAVPPMETAPASASIPTSSSVGPVVTDGTMLPDTMMPNTVRMNPAAPPQTMPPSYLPANSRQRAQPWADTLNDGQIFTGLTAMPQQAGFYTVMARTQAEFNDLWLTHIGQQPPLEKMEDGQVAIFATSGPRSFSGYDVNLKVVYTSPQRIQVMATEVSPSSTIAQTRVDTSPWQVLIIRSWDAKVEVLHRRELAGSAFH